MADAAGTLYLDEAKRAWSDADPGGERCRAGHDAAAPRRLRRLGHAQTGDPRRAGASSARWSSPPVPAMPRPARSASARSTRVTRFISLGTSSQYFVTRERYEPKPETLIHAFAHALPGRWFEMAAMLNGASVPRLGGALPRRRHPGPARRASRSVSPGRRRSCSCPTSPASGRRTTIRRRARGFFGLDNTTSAEDLAQAVLEGVAFSLIDAQIALHAAGRAAAPVAAIGGGARSRLLAEADRERHRCGRASGCRLRQGPGLRCRAAGPAGADRRSAGRRLQQAGDHRDDRARRGPARRLWRALPPLPSLYRSLKQARSARAGRPPAART